MNFKRLALFATLGLPLFASADDYPHPKMELKLAEYNIKFRDYNFPSGLRVIFQEDHSQPVVSVTAVNDRGSTSDPIGKEGIAHLIEHLWFRSHQADDKGGELPKVWNMLEQMGASMNAFTADDQTVYQTMAGREHLATLMRMERMRMLTAVHGVVSDVMVIERDVVRNELRMRYENSTGAAFGYLMVKLFPQSHPYGRSASAGIGSHESLDSITIDDVQAFTKENYGPDKTTIVISGDVNLDDSWKLIEENLGYDILVDPKNPKAPLEIMAPKPHLPVVKENPGAPVQAAESKGELTGLTVERGPVEKPFVMIGWSLPPGWRNDARMMEVAAAQMWPAIYRQLDPGWDPSSAELPTSGGCGVNEQVYASAAYCFIEISKSDDPAKIAETALDGLYRAWELPESSELEYQKYQNWVFNYSKNIALASLFQGVDLTLSLFSQDAVQAAMYAHYTGDLQYYSRQFEAINGVDRLAVRDFAQKYLNRSRAVALAMVPYEEGDLVLDSSNSVYRGGNRADGAAPMLGADKLTAEIISAAVKAPDVSKVKEEKLANGLRVVVLPYSVSPLLQMDLSFKGGAASAFPRGYANFANSMWTDRSFSIDSLAIAGFDGFGISNTSTSYQVSSSVANTEQALYMLRERLENLGTDTNGKLDWAAANKKDIYANQKLPEWWADTVQMERLLPAHFLSDWLNHGDYDSMKKWSDSVVNDVFSNILRPDNGTLLLVGNLDSTKAIEMVKQYMGGWTGWGKPPETKVALSTEYAPFPPPPARQIILFDKKVSSQSNVNYTCQLPKVDAQGEAAAKVLGSVLDGSAWLALREETGASYGANAFAQTYAGGSTTLGMASLVQNNFAAKAVQAFLGLGEKAQKGNLDPLMVATKKYGLAQTFVIGQQSTSMMMTRIQGLINLNRPLDYYAGWAKALGLVDIPMMQKLMEPCVGHEVVTVVGPLEVIKPLFEQAGMAVEVYDWEKARLDYAAKYGIKLPKPPKPAKGEAAK